jgi:cytoskeletal protein CcmA (bactofilin family)
MFSKSSNPSTSQPPLRTPRANGGALTIIASDVSIQGNLTTVGEIQLDGTVMGDISCGSIILGETGSMTGILVATTATIRGRVDGTIRAKAVLLERTAVVTGDVTQESISIEAGAKVDGRFLNRANPHEVTNPEATPLPNLKAV